MSLQDRTNSFNACLKWSLILYSKSPFRQAFCPANLVKKKFASSLEPFRINIFSLKRVFSWGNIGEILQKNWGNS